VLNNRFDNKTSQLLNEFLPLLAAPVAIEALPAVAAAAPAIGTLVAELLAPLIALGGALAIHHNITSRSPSPGIEVSPQVSPDSAPSKRKLLPDTIAPIPEPEKETAIPAPEKKTVIPTPLGQTASTTNAGGQSVPDISATQTKQPTTTAVAPPTQTTVDATATSSQVSPKYMPPIPPIPSFADYSKQYRKGDVKYGQPQDIPLGVNTGPGGIYSQGYGPTSHKDTSNTSPMDVVKQVFTGQTPQATPGVPQSPEDVENAPQVIKNRYQNRMAQKSNKETKAFGGISNLFNR
jgi:hypothetical protein